MAFRTGGGRRKKEGPRMHIFWQKRIREDDTGDLASGGTPYWFPSLTGAGAIGEDRLVLPIPPGTHWSDAKPVVLPEGPRPRKGGEGADEVKLLEDEVSRLEREKKGLRGEGRGSRGKNKSEADVKARGKAKPVAAIEMGGLRFGPPPPDVSVGGHEASGSSAVNQAAERAVAKAIEAELKAAKKAVRAAKKKFDPAQEAFARELKDRWLEQVQREPGLIEGAARPRYAVGRRVEHMSPTEAPNGLAAAIEQPQPPEAAPEATPEMKRLDAA